MALLQDFGFLLLRKKLLASSAVAFACLLRGVERDMFVQGDRSASKCLQASRSPAELIALVIAPT